MLLQSNHLLEVGAKNEAENVSQTTSYLVGCLSYIWFPLPEKYKRIEYMAQNSLHCHWELLAMKVMCHFSVTRQEKTSQKILRKKFWCHEWNRVCHNPKKMEKPYITIFMIFPCNKVYWRTPWKTCRFSTCRTCRRSIRGSWPAGGVLPCFPRFLRWAF